MGASHSDLCGVVAGRLPLRVRCEDGSPSELITEPFLARACPECIEGKRAMGMVERDFQHPARPRSTGIATCGGQLSWVLPASGLVHDQETYQGIGCRRLMPAWVRADLKPAPTVSSWVHNTFPNTWSGVALGLPMGKQSSHSLRVVRIRNVGLRDPAVHASRRWGGVLRHPGHLHGALSLHKHPVHIQSAQLNLDSLVKSLCRSN